MSKAAVVLKQKHRFVGERRIHRIPIDRIRQVDVEVCDDRFALQRHVRRGWEISLLHVLQIADQRLLRRAAGAGVPLDRPLIDHDREREAGMLFGFCHYQLGGLILCVPLAIPIDDHAIDATADHVGDLVVNLGGARRTVADVHVVRAAEPEHEVSIDFCGCARIKQRVHVDLADVSGPRIPIRLAVESVGCTGVIAGQRRQRGCRLNRISCDTHTARTHEQG